MAFAILKLSYIKPGDSSLTGGICGTGFFIDPQTAVTAHHVLNENIIHQFYWWVPAMLSR